MHGPNTRKYGLEKTKNCPYLDNFHAVMRLLQNATDVIIKCDNYFIIKRDKFMTKYVNFLLQKATVLLRIVTIITKCDVFYKIHWHNEPQKCTTVFRI